MKNKLLIPIVVFSILVGCKSHKMAVKSIEDYTGFTGLPFPSNNFKPSQIVEIYTKPRKVEITYKPDSGWDQISWSDGWNITASNTTDLKANLSVEIGNLLESEGTISSNSTVEVKFTNTQSAYIEKYQIYSSIKESLEKKQGLRSMINNYIDNGIHFDVITTTLSASISFSVRDSINNVITLDPTQLKKLNTRIGANWQLQKGNNLAISSENLVIGFHYDPNLIKIVMAELESIN